MNVSSASGIVRSAAALASFQRCGFRVGHSIFPFSFGARNVHANAHVDLAGRPANRN